MIYEKCLVRYIATVFTCLPADKLTHASNTSSEDRIVLHLVNENFLCNSNYYDFSDKCLSVFPRLAISPDFKIAVDMLPILQYKFNDGKTVKFI